MALTNLEKRDLKRRVELALKSGASENTTVARIAPLGYKAATIRKYHRSLRRGPFID
jgi:hypothetical protein